MTVAAETIALHSRRLRPSLERWVAAEPADATAALLLGALEVDRAWKIRGGALAADTRLHMARGQQVGLVETLARRDRLAELSPQHFMGHYMAVGSLSPMWGYSRQVMYTQVQNWTSAASAGSLLHALVFIAHIERWRRGTVV